MINGKLTEEGREALNVSVVFHDTESNSEFFLEDQEGQFVTVPAVDLEAPGKHGSSSSDDAPDTGGEDTIEGLRGELDALREENRSLNDQVAGLEQKVVDEKARFCDLWQTKCWCLAEYDTMITAKESQIEELKRQRSALDETHSEIVISGCSKEPTQPPGSQWKAPPVDAFTRKDMEICVHFHSF